MMKEMQKPIVGYGLSVAAAVAVAILAGGAVRVDAQSQANRTGGPSLGIAVHGHWTIDVRQPDGTLVTHREFENDLFPSGGAEIANILAGRRIPGGWSVVLQGSPNNQPCLSGASNPVPCLLQEPDWIYQAGDGIFNNLTVEPVGLVLKGTATGGRVGSITFVSTNISTCNSTILVSTCATYATATGPGTGLSINLGFSGTSVSPPIDVVAGQLISVEVSYTFSAGGATVVQ